MSTPMTRGCQAAICSNRSARSPSLSGQSKSSTSASVPPTRTTVLLGALPAHATRKFVIDQELEGLQPAMTANHDDRGDDDVRTDQRLEAGTAQDPRDAVPSRGKPSQWFADRGG